MKYMVFLLLFGTVLNDNVFAQPCIPPEGEIFFNRAMKEINVKHSNWVKSTAASAKQNNSSQQTISQFASTYGGSLNLGTMDIEALISLVMMQMAKDANEDMRQILEDMKKQNEKKKALRDAVNKMKKDEASKKEMLRSEYDSLRRILTASTTVNSGRVMEPVKRVTPDLTMASLRVTPAQVAQLKIEFLEKLDSMSEINEMKSLRLQMYMESYSKYTNTISGMLKKFSDTSDSIIGNLK